ncbi:MAG TPA: hypothetical protein DEH22_01930 [Chloroflexi bacterium]|nr:hypothetical protein [Chloroflexota bacterium]
MFRAMISSNHQIKFSAAALRRAAWKTTCILVMLAMLLSNFTILAQEVQADEASQPDLVLPESNDTELSALHKNLLFTTSIHPMMGQVDAIKINQEKATTADNATYYELIKFNETNISWDTRWLTLIYSFYECNIPVGQWGDTIICNYAWKAIDTSKYVNHHVSFTLKISSQFPNLPIYWRIENVSGNNCGRPLSKKATWKPIVGQSEVYPFNGTGISGTGTLFTNIINTFAKIR